MGNWVRKLGFWGLALLGVVLVQAIALPGGHANTTQANHGAVPATGVDFTLLQLNDVYEITPVANGTSGGLARVATLRQELLAENPNTFTVLGGDILSPSALGTARVDGERLAGKQMVSVLNQMGLDYATFGNHEFDISEAAFRDRLAESEFQWFSGNVTDANGDPFPDVPTYAILEIPNGDAAPLKVGLIGLTLDSNQAPYVAYKDPIEVTRAQIEDLKDRTDLLIGLTHLAIEGDRQLAETFPDLDLILGGHEHENIQQWRLVNKPDRPDACNAESTPIFKADANARTVYVHRVHYEPDSNCLTVAADLVPITGLIADEPETQAIVEGWVDIAFAGFRADGFEPEQIAATTTVPLDGREAIIRNQSNALTDLIAQAMLQAAPDAELSIFNGGSIRIDDVLPPGPISEYDIIRILPFGGDITVVDMGGELLAQVLAAGQGNRGNGGFLQTAHVSGEPGSWLIQDQPLDPSRVYRVAIADFLLTGQEANLGFLTADAPGLTVVSTQADIRKALIEALR
ncbi:MAG: bifunctional metallophosphatase/5'-nucleotidase [Cyanobacteria bacterium]|nr:bifunctional metallophosphatase/5'-nucleotidase [Cyanobacteriota bacterium]MDA0867215.1 bifunctional metallophosphatase/5'-nucleotidase [Cyanobacteriota bacterium]